MAKVNPFEKKKKEGDEGYTLHADKPKKKIKNTVYTTVSMYPGNKKDLDDLKGKLQRMMSHRDIDNSKTIRTAVAYVLHQLKKRDAEIDAEIETFLLNNI